MRNLEKGQHIFIAFQDGKAVLDSQLRPRIYTSLENADKWTPTVNKGKIEYVEYAPALTPPNEWVSVDNKLPKNGVPVLIGNPHWDYPVVASCAGYGVWMDSWHQKMTFTQTYWMPLPAPFNRRPPEGEEDI